jgi:hypothetical protein
MSEGKALVGNAADPQQVKEARQKQKLARERELNDLRVVLQHRPGRRFVWSLLCRCGIFDVGFSTDPATMGFSAGMRNLGLLVMKDLEEADETAYQTMAMEARSEAKNA